MSEARSNAAGVLQLYKLKAKEMLDNENAAGEGVIEIEGKSRTVNGKYPLTDQQLIRSYWDFNEWHPMAKYCNYTYLPCGTPVHKCRGIPQSKKAKCKSTCGARKCRRVKSEWTLSENEASCDSGPNKTDLQEPRSINGLPDDVILVIFRSFHQIELAHTICFVCRKWYRLCQTPCLWQRIRIYPCQTAFCRRALRKFLEKFGRSIKKLCIQYRQRESKSWSATDFEDFPTIMPSVATLSLVDCYYFTKPMARFIIERFPNLETLNLHSITNDQGALGLIASEGFPRLKELHLRSYGSYHEGVVKIQDFDALFESRPLRSLTVRSVVDVDASVCNRIANARMALFLTSLCIDCHQTDDSSCCGVLASCKNLRLLSIMSLGNATDKTLEHIKMLTKLEHLQLGFSEEVTENGLKRLFENDGKMSSNSKTFPEGLKYLSFTVIFWLTDSVIDTITATCPTLESLSLCACGKVTDVGFGYVIHRLSELRFLDLENSLSSGMVMSTITPLDLVKLEYLCVVGLHIDVSILHTLNLQRKKLIIRYGYRNGFFLAFELSDGIAKFYSRSDALFREAVWSKFSKIEGFSCMSSI